MGRPGRRRGVRGRTIGEIVYAGSATALVSALAPAHVLGRTLARFELSTGFGLAVSPAVITALAPHGPTALWGSLAAATLVSAAAVAGEKDEDRGPRPILACAPSSPGSTSPDT